MTYPSPQQQPVRKKAGCLTWGAIVAGVVIFVGSCSALMSSTNDFSSTAPASHSVASQPAPLLLEASDMPQITKEQKSALRKAERYSEMMHMSKQGIYDQLTSEFGEQFTPEEAQYAVDNLEP